MKESNKNKIPNKLKVGGQDLNVVFTNTIIGDKMGEFFERLDKINEKEINEWKRERKIFE